MLEALTAWWESLGVWSVAFEVLFILAGAFLAWAVLQFMIRRVVRSIVHGVKRKQGVDDTQALAASPLAAVRLVQRTRTLGSVLSSVVTSAVVIVAAILVVTKLAPDAAGALSLLTAAIGAGLGFGAQNIVKDVLNGLFMVIEDQLGVGDVVDLGPATGVVERVGVRITDIRDVNGTLWHVRNGEVLRVGNLSQGWARSIIDLAVPYEHDTDEVQKVILDTALAMAAESKWRRVILERPELWGIESISADAVVVRLVVKTRTSAKDEVSRELRARLKRALDAEGIRLPSLTTVVLTGYEGAGSILGHRPPKTTPLPVQQAIRTPRPKRGAKPEGPGAKP